jgi:hypothetical protein
MTEPRERAAVPSHWHVFRQEESGVKRYMLPIYTKHSDAVAAVAALKVHDPRTYGVEECQDHPCHK